MKRLINIMKRSQLDHPPTPAIIHIQEKGIYKDEGGGKESSIAWNITTLPQMVREQEYREQTQRTENGRLYCHKNLKHLLEAGVWSHRIFGRHVRSEIGASHKYFIAGLKSLPRSNSGKCWLWATSLSLWLRFHGLPLLSVCFYSCSFLEPPTTLLSLGR